MPHRSSPQGRLAAVVLFAGLASSLGFANPGQFVSVFEHPKIGLCQLDLHRPGKGETSDAAGEAEAGRNHVSKERLEFRGIRPIAVAKAQRLPSCD